MQSNLGTLQFKQTRDHEELPSNLGTLKIKQDRDYEELQSSLGMLQTKQATDHDALVARQTADCEAWQDVCTQ